MNKIIFSKPKASARSLPRSLVSLILVLTLVIGALIYWSINDARDEKVIVWAFVTIISIRILFAILSALKANVYQVEMDLNKITLNYYNWNRDQQVIWPIRSTEINLLEKLNNQGFFEGIEIQFKNDGKKLKLKENVWDYADFENIYFEFKKIKNESVPEDEVEALKQLQIMNDV